MYKPDGHTDHYVQFCRVDTWQPSFVRVFVRSFIRSFVR